MVAPVVLQAMAALWAGAWQSGDSDMDGEPEETPSRMYIARNLALLALTLPNLGHILRVCGPHCRLRIGIGAWRCLCWCLTWAPQGGIAMLATSMM